MGIRKFHRDEPVGGTDALAADVLGMETRVGMPRGLDGGLVEEVCDPKFATAVGLVLYGLRPEPLGGAPVLADMGIRALHENGTDDGLLGGLARRMKSWFDEL